MRLHSSAGPATLVGDLCPGCGSLLEPVGELAEIVGFQSIEHREQVPDDGSADGPQRIADRLDALSARRAATLTPEAVSKAIALAAPNENP